jgi:hypothetical protein
MKASFITLSTEEILALSPRYRQKIRDSVTPKQISTSDGEKDLPTAATHLNQVAALPFIKEVTESLLAPTDKVVPLAATAGLDGYIVQDIYGANHLEAACFVQAPNRPVEKIIVTLTPNLPARDGYSLRKSLQKRTSLSWWQFEYE